MFLEHTQQTLITTIIIYNNYTKQSKTQSSLHMMVYNENQVPEKKQIINKLRAEGSDLLYL